MTYCYADTIVQAAESVKNYYNRISAAFHHPMLSGDPNPCESAHMQETGCCKAQHSDTPPTPRCAATNDLESVPELSWDRGSLSAHLELYGKPGGWGVNPTTREVGGVDLLPTRHSTRSKRILLALKAPKAKFALIMPPSEIRESLVGGCGGGQTPLLQRKLPSAPSLPGKTVT